MLEKIKKNNKGFTLVELIVVIAILGVLMAVLVPQYIQYVEKSRVGVDESYIAEIAHVMELTAASDLNVNGKSVTITITHAGVITGPETSTPESAALMTELAAVFPTANQKFVSTTYKATSGTTYSPSLLLGTNGSVTISGTKNING